MRAVSERSKDYQQYRCLMVTWSFRPSDKIPRDGREFKFSSEDVNYFFVSLSSCLKSFRLFIIQQISFRYALFTQIVPIILWLPRVENKGKYNFLELNVTCVIEIDQIAASKISSHLFTSENRFPWRRVALALNARNGGRARVELLKVDKVAFY